MITGREQLLTAVVEKLASKVRSMFTANQFPIGETKVGGSRYVSFSISPVNTTGSPSKNSQKNSM